MSRRKKNPTPIEADSAALAGAPQSGAQLHAGDGSTGRWLASIGLLCLAGVAVYANSLDGSFVFDDTDSIINNANIRSLTPITQAMKTRPDQTCTATGRPVVCLTLAINYAIGELNTRGYHMFNVAVHILAALMLFALLRRALLLAYPDWAGWLPLSAALLWVVHPLNTDALNHVIYRTELMMGLAYLTVLYCALRAGSAQRVAPGWVALAAVVCFLGMGCKENMISAPVAAVMLDRAVLSRSLGQTLRQRGWVYALLFIVALAGFAFSRWSGVRRDAVGFNQDEFTVLRYLLVQCVVLVHYVRLTLWPQPLVFDYYEWPDPHAFGEAAWQVAVVVALIIGLTVLWMRRPLWALPWIVGWFILAPTSLIPNAGERLGEHRMYLPMIPILICVLGGLYWLSTRAQWSVAAGRGVRGAVVAVLAIALGLTTIARNRVYARELSVWQDVVSKQPGNARAWRGVAESKYHEAQNTADRAAAITLFQEAVADFEESLKIEPHHGETYLNMGKIFQEDLKHLPESSALAMASYTHALETQPSASLHTNLANLLMTEGRRPEALHHYRAAVAIEPYFVNALYGLGQVLLMEGDAAGAEQAYLTALSRPSLAATAVRIKLAVLYRNTDQFEKAEKEYLQVISESPNDPSLHFDLGRVYEGMGREQDAIAQYRKALHLRPNYANARSALDRLGG